MLVIGLTGGIGSGKTAASRLFEKLGVSVVDTDKLSRECVKPGLPAYEQIVEQFGVHILKKDGAIDRAKLRTIIFSEPSKRLWLEKLLHPLIEEKAMEAVRLSDGPYCILVIPLLVETDSRSLVNRVLVIDVPEDLQVERVVQRDGMKPGQAKSILATQATRQVRLDAADDVICNDQDFDTLENNVMDLHEKYLALAKT